MPISPGTTIPIFTNALSGNALVGKSAVQVATALSTGLFNYVKSGVVTTSIDSGVLGAGTGIGPTVILPSATILPALIANMAVHKIVGLSSPQLANAISIGVSLSLAGAIVNTINSSVGVGVGKGIFVPTGAGGGLFTAAFISSGLVGLFSPSMATAIGLALDSVIASAVSIIVIAGSPSQVPSTGIGTGTIN